VCVLPVYIRFSKAHGKLIIQQVVPFLPNLPSHYFYKANCDVSGFTWCSVEHRDERGWPGKQNDTKEMCSRGAGIFPRHP
jgi:hypothetical protein